jgi:hypothetical protein
MLTAGPERLIRRGAGGGLRQLAERREPWAMQGRNLRNLQAQTLDVTK